MSKNNSENYIIHVVKENYSNLETALKTELNLSGRLFRKLKKENCISVKSKKNDGINSNDIIYITLEEENNNYQPQNIPLEILYEDFDILIINKMPNIVVHPTKSHVDNTIANAISYYFKSKNICKKIRFVNRLDMDTSGVLVAAKNSFGHQQLASQFENNIVNKRYITVVEGILKQDKGIINSSIKKDENNPILYTVHDKGKESITKYNVRERFKNASLVECEIITGRTHQIRVHMSSIGHPIIGDSLYNKKSDFIKRQALHSNYLKFKVPRTGEILEINAPIPEDMKKLINKLK